ncbi:3-oxoacyl-[acyl-carrier protein] reductase [Kibdelosporangium banguiense]|uniref:3-oxoacyl-[acyl-carrier protein] reductase n=1 Tax=Kibdelosporangium banguiense TaxID=1365924 RepID=A0ABS4TNR1_9PSEU|nr:SDR family NAD(P)-dependent oxidoreductase [Kibdelosporangium banguiense]MBP2326047.1 3-oxoacyl-[acyl-carrier protein] reductase [Kibdelosporangium banguiense]
MNSVRIGLAGKVALVTGAGSGIGQAVARKLSDLGAQLVLADVNADAVERVAGAVANARALSMDVSDVDQVDRVIGGIGRLDVVVHAAGVDDPVAKEWIADAMLACKPPEVTARLEIDTWRRVMAVNLDGTFHVLRASLRAMTSGSIVVIGSSSAFDAPTGYPHYSASKAGVHALAQAVAKEAIAFGVRVNVVAPGPTETGMAARTPAVMREAFSGSYATPEQIADIAVFLAGEQSSNLVGAVLLANGGRFTS